MSVVEQERTTTTIVLPATELEHKLQQMIDLVQEGKWCKGHTFHPDQYHRCTLGLVIEVCQP